MRILLSLIMLSLCSLSAFSQEPASPPSTERQESLKPVPNAVLGGNAALGGNSSPGFVTPPVVQAPSGGDSRIGGNAGPMNGMPPRTPPELIGR